MLATKRMSEILKRGPWTKYMTKCVDAFDEGKFIIDLSLRPTFYFS